MRRSDPGGTIDATTSRDRPIDARAIAAFSLAAAAALTVPWWLVSAVLAVAAIGVALASRRALEADPRLRGVGLGLGGFLLAGATLFFTAGPRLVSSLVFAPAPPG